MRPALDEIIQDVRALETRIRAYERKYGITSQDFYALYQEGLLDDEGFEQTTEFTRWASAYAMKIERETAFEIASHSFVESLRQTSRGQTIRLTPNPQLVQS
ncbi:MAG: hypothetical protein HC802_16435 [Caldilineaceae bacterium]|nr:hypothetical protein [Caldilineaceae bacterium]